MFSALCSNTNNPHLSPKSSLSLAWSESKLSKSRIEAFALKTELLFDDYFYCFYISNDTKAFVDQYHYTNPYSLGVDIESMEINYPRYFKHLFDTGVLSSKDCMFVYKVDLSNDYVEYEFDDFVLIDVICLVKSLNTTYEKSFVVSVSYNIDNKKAIFTDEIEPFFQLYSNAKILLYNILHSMVNNYFHYSLKIHHFHSLNHDEQ